MEKAIHESGLSYAILRPTVLFSPEDVLINNIAWFLRRFPAFPIAGPGDYPIQPVFVDDLAQLAVNAGAGSEDVVLDAVGPETFTFEEMVRLIARRVGSRARLIHVRPSVALLAARMAGWLVRDVVLTRDEIDGLLAGHLVSADPHTASTRFTEWLEAEGRYVGTALRLGTGPPLPPRCNGLRSRAAQERTHRLGLARVAFRQLHCNHSAEEWQPV